MFKKYFVPVLKVFGFLAAYFIGLIVIAGLLYTTLGSMAGAEVSSFLSGAAGIFVALVVVYLYLKLDHSSFRGIGSGFSPGWHEKLIKGGIEGAAVQITILMILLATGFAAFRGLSASSLTGITGKLVLGLVRFLILVAFTEELITRGYIYHYLNTRFTAYGAAVVTSFIFALMHVFNPSATILALFNIFLAGLVLNLLVMRDGNIWSAVGFHFGWNFTMGVVFSTPVSGGAEEGIIKLALKGNELLTGGSFGVEGGLVSTGVLLLTAGYMVYRNKGAEQFLEGMKLWKNRVFTGTLIIVTLIYVIFDILVWMPKPVVPDSIETNKIQRPDDVNDYTLKLELDTKHKVIKGQQTVSFINSEKENLREAYFHIYANAFKNLNGSIEIAEVKVNGEKVQYKIEGEDLTLLNVPFYKVLEPGERNDIYIEYLINIPRKGDNSFGDRFAYGSNTFNLGNFFPIAAVYENSEWDKHPYDKKGDAFYSETSNFDVTITAPEDQVIASSGYVGKKEVLDGLQTISIKAYSARDFAFVSSDMFRVREAMINGTLIKSYASSDTKAKKVLEISADAIRLFNKKYGKYPYPTCSVVQTDIGGGMEYPNLVMIESDGYGNVTLGNLFSSFYYGRPKGALEFVVVHELAHQWWYSLVGNDEYREAWIDEPLTQYATLVYFREKYGDKEFERIYNNNIKMGVKMYLATNGGQDKPLNRSLNEFDEMGYYTLIYNKGAMMFKDLNDELGEENFDKLLKTLFEKYKFKVVKGEELIELTSEIAGRDMSEFYRRWLTTNYTSDEL